MSAMHTETVPVDDRDTLHSWYDAAQEARHHDRPDAPFLTEQEAVVMVTTHDSEERILPFVTCDGAGTVVGAGAVFVPLLDNLDKAYFELSVRPAHRGRGAGDAAIEHVLALIRAEGRRLAIGEGFFPADADDDHPVRAFALRHGFTLGNTEVRRTLELPVPEERIRGWTTEAAKHHEGYEIRTYEDLLPDELLPSLVELHNQLAVDAPTGDIEFEAGRMTVEIFLEHVEKRRRSGRQVLESVAVKDGRTVAQSTLSVPPKGAELPHMSQWGTFVDRAHRGHRLGMAVKAANLLAVQRLFPERTLLHTTNSPVNGPMVAINEEIGFRPRDVMGEFVRAL